MDYDEDHGPQDAPERCEECGARLTPQEIRAVLESGAPSLCAVHSAEVVPVAEEESDFDSGRD